MVCLRLRGGRPSAEASLLFDVQLPEIPEGEDSMRLPTATSRLIPGRVNCRADSAQTEESMTVVRSTRQSSACRLPAGWCQGKGEAPAALGWEAGARGKAAPRQVRTLGLRV